MKIWIFLIKFLFIGALFIVSNNHLYLSDPTDFDSFVGLFHTWLANIFLHSLQITGYVINSEWLPPGNESFILGRQ